MRHIIPIIIVFAALFAAASFAQQPKCDYKVEILTNGSDFQANDFKWRMKAVKIEGTPTNITGTAKIEYDGNVVKSYKPWTSESISKQKTSSEYSPNLKSGKYSIIAEINVECDDTNKDNNIGTKTISINLLIDEKPAKSVSINSTPVNNITKAETSDAKANESFGVNSTQENITKEIDKIKNISSIKSKSADLGENEKTDNVIYIKKSANQNLQLDEKTQATASAVRDSGTVYESTSEKSKELVIVFLLVLSVLLNIILIWKR